MKDYKMTMYCDHVKESYGYRAAREKAWTQFVCKCGHVYKYKAEDNYKRFYKVDAEGNEHPYMRNAFFRGWVKDEEAD